MSGETPTTLCAAFQRHVSRIPAETAVRTPDGSVSYTWREYGDRVRRVAAGLAALGVGRGDTVGIMLTNRPEFHVVDSAALHLGAVPFSVYNTSAREQLSYVFGNADNPVVFCERQFVPTLREAIEGTKVEHLVSVDGEADGAITLDELEAKVGEDFDFDAAWRTVEQGDVATLIYTSGTTGPPKGVELTHANLLAEVDAVTDIVPLDHTDAVISYLPDAHAANRVQCQYMSIGTGIQVITVADPKQVIDALTQLRPTFFAAVPQIWYKLKAKLEAALAAEHGVKKTLGTWAVETGKKVAQLRSDGKSVPLPLKVQHTLADKLVLAKLRSKLGMDNFRLAASGAAPIAPDTMAFVLGLGIPVSEVWGMSELSALVTFNPLDAPRIGTVGKPVKGMELKLAEDGEILAKGPLVMRGYRKDPEKTAETVDPDGWLATGDIGTIDADGYLSIVDRKKELMINAAGKNMSPSNIENTVKVACPLVGSVIAIGDNRKYVTALIALEPDAAAEFAEGKGITAIAPDALAVNPEIYAEIEASVTAANEKLSRVEQIKKFTVLPTLWEPGGDELTPTMKLKRKPIAQKYQAEIEALYA
ncbi:MAG: AMP-binding protein [Actinophytocola sp.]|nr:AMP-binding protein [Actinophytocola sp.]